MKLLQAIRSFAGMIALPLLTFTASILAIFFGGILRIPPEKLQWIPRNTWAQILCWINGVTVEVRGLENIDLSRSYIFAGNHQSQIDIFSLQAALGFDFRWMAKKELFRIPLFGWGMKLAGYIPVDRSGGKKALKSLDEAAKRIAGGTSVIIFPEGTRSRDGQIHPFKAGGMILAIKSKVPLVPLAIHGTYELLPKGKLFAKSGKVVIVFGEPIETAEYSTKQKHELADRLHDVVVALKRQAEAISSQ